MGSKRSPGAESNAIKVAIIDKGADIHSHFRWCTSTSTVGTQVQTASANANGAKSGFIYQWDSTTIKSL